MKAPSLQNSDSFNPDRRDDMKYSTAKLDGHINAALSSVFKNISRHDNNI